MRRRLKRVAVGFGALLLLLLAVLVGGYAWLRSEAGGELVRAQVVAAVNGAVKGRLEVRHASLRRDTVVLEDLRLYTPEGELVASVPRLVVQGDLPALAQGRIALRRVAVEAPELFLERDARGLNLVRAVEAKVPSRDGPPTRLDFRVDALELGGGRVRYREGGKEQRLEGLEASGAARGHTGPLVLDGALRAGATLEGLVQGPLALQAKARPSARGGVDAEVALDAAGAALRASFAGDDARVTVQRLEVPPALGRALAGPEWPGVVLGLSGSATQDAADVALDLGSAGRVGVKATYALAESRVPSLELRFDAVDPSALGKGLPPGRLGGTVQGRLDDFRPESFKGEGTAVLALRDEAGAQAVGLEAQFSVEDGALKVPGLALELPGATARVRGGGSSKGLALFGHLEALSLGQASRAVAGLVGAEAPPLEGQGSLDVRVVGAPLHPAVSATGKLAFVAWGDTRADGVQLELALPDVRQPRNVQARVEAKVVRAGGRSFEGVRAGVATRGKELEVELTSQGTASLRARARGRFEGAQALRLLDAELSWPQATWTLDGESSLRWGEATTLAPLTLRSDHQALTVEATAANGKVSARASVSDLALAKLPAALGLGELGLGGLVSGEAQLRGRSQAPDWEARLSWKDGRVRGLEGLEATASVAAQGARASGTVEVKAPVGRVTGRFDLPLAPAKAKGEAPASVSLVLEELDVQKAARAAGVRSPLRGTLRVNAVVQGTVAAPALTVEASLLGGVLERDGGQAEVPVHSASLLLETGADGALSAGVDVLSLGATLHLGVRTPLRAADLLWRTPSPQAFRALGWDADFELQGLALSALASTFPGALEGVDGEVLAKGTAQGPATAPTGAAQLRVNRLHTATLRPLDLELGLRADAGRTALSVTASSGPTKLLGVEAAVDAAAAALADARTLDAAPFTLEAQLGPFDLGRVLEPAAGGGPGSAAGGVRAHLSGHGSLGAPRLSLKGDVRGLGLAKVALGSLDLSADYALGAATAALVLTSANGGRLDAQGRLELDLSASAVRRGLDASGAKLEAGLKASGLDLAFLSGVHPRLRVVGGRLDAEATARGTLGDPALEGRVAWSGGRLGVAGFAEYREVNLVVAADPRRISVDQLAARSGAGKLSLTALATRGAAGPWRLEAALDTQRLPLVTDDQLRAIADLKVRVVGEASERLVDLREVRIPEAHVELPELRKKDVQSLDRPKDIVLVRGGVALGPRPRRWGPKGGAGPGQAVAVRSGPAVRALLVAPDNLWVDSTDVHVQLGLEDGFRVELDDELSLSGVVRIISGRVDVIGRKFEVQAGSNVRFTGSPKEPYLNVTAQHVNERERVTVYATLVGKGKEFAFKTSSQPALSESEIYSLLATGRRSLKRGSGAAISAEQAVSVLGAFAAQQVKKALSKKLPIDVVDVLSFEAGSEGFRGARIEAGKYLSDRLYLGYVGQVGADKRKGENAHAGRVEYQFAPKWTVEAYGGDAPAAGADVVWGTEF